MAVPGVAVGQLLVVEGNYGMLDGVVTNPLVSGPVRDKALDCLFAALIDRASQIGITQLLGFTMHPQTAERAKRHGFYEIAATLLAKEL